MWVLLLACRYPGGPPDVGGCTEARVEFPESANECETDDDCLGQGCGGEVCAAAPTDSDPGLVSTCEYHACFDKLGDCGCVDNRCRWSRW
jgi:eight-cysteine-cluster-containing protein